MNCPGRQCILWRSLAVTSTPVREVGTWSQAGERNFNEHNHHQPHRRENPFLCWTFSHRCIIVFLHYHPLHSTILTMIMIMREIYGDMMTKARHEFWWATVFNLTNSNSHWVDLQLGNKKHLQMLLIKDIALVLCNFRTEHKFILGSFLKGLISLSILLPLKPCIYLCFHVISDFRG